MWISIGANWLSAVSFLVAYALSANLWLLVPSGIFALAGIVLLLVWQSLGKRLQAEP
jgi:hypothetical protein